MKKYFGLFVAWFLALTANAGNVGDWNLYLAYHNAVDCQPVGDEVYASYDGNLLAYYPKDGEVRTLSKLNGLNGRSILSMGYSETEKCLLLVYDNFQIDLVYPSSGEIVSMPQIKNSGMDGLVMNQLFISGDDVVLATNNGVTLLNLKKQEVAGYYQLDQNILAAACYNGVLYAAGETQLYACDMKGNPLDKGEWKVAESAAFIKFLKNGNHLYGITKSMKEGMTAGLWLLKSDGKTFVAVSDKVYPHAFAQNGKLVLADGAGLVIYNQKDPLRPEITISHKNEWNALSRAADGMLWASEGEKGMQAYKISGNALKAVGEPVGNIGPKRDLCYYMRYHGNRLLIAGGRLDPFDAYHYPGTLMELTDGEWKFFQEKGIADYTGVFYRDITSLAVDPKNENHIVASAGGTGLYDFVDYKFTKQLTNSNSPLESATSNGDRHYVRVDGLNYDAEGNLWMVNNTQRDTILRAMRPDGTWKSFYIEPIKNASTCEKTLIDKKGRLWVASRRTVDNPHHEGGLLCLDYKGTLNDTKDDVYTYRSTFVNQDGKSYFLGGVYCMAEDHDGAIWVGTRAGLFVVSNPEGWNSPNFYVTQVKVPRNDGTNLADYLLSDMPISAIAIDGAGRKWIGSETNGLYLVSPDGMEILKHFEEDNSPLLSNYIYSIAPNLQTGEIMIGTDKGLCSYQSAATEAMPSLSEGNLKVYPNPVRPEYHGDVRVTGLTDRAEVKVMTTDGEVVAVGNSTGGTFVWDVKDGSGARVAPGVYYFMIATADGKKGVAAKVVVI